MPILRQLSVTFHVLAAMVWLGGMFFLALVGAPVLRKLESPSLRARLFRELGEGARRVGWVCIGVLLVTGVTNLHFRGVLSLATRGEATFWNAPFGHALAWKLVAVGVMVGASAVHDFFLGPLAGRLPEGTDGRERARRWSAIVARLNAGIGVFLVYWAVRLSRGG
ncbi:MAG: DUF4149 domain-containing protein [Gemmatimonadota bacterium]